MIYAVVYILTILLYGLSLVFYVHHYIVDPKYSLPSLIFWILSVFFTIVLIIVSLTKRMTKNGLTLKKIIQTFRQHYILIFLVIIGFFLRFFWVNSIPILTHDEGKDTGLFPIKILSAEITSYFGFNAGINNIFFVVAAIPHLLFTDPLMKVRFFSFYFGTLAIMLIYIYVAAVSTKKTALIAASLLAFYHVHIHFSRSEFLILFDSFYSLVVLLAFFYLSGKMHKWSIILFGLALGLGLHFYSGLRAIISLAVLLYIALLFVRCPFKKILSGLLIFFIFFMIGLGPTLYEFVRNTQDSKATGTAVVINTQQKNWVNTLTKNYITSLRAYTFTNIDFHYNYGGPFIVFPFAILFYLGIIKMLTRIRNSNYILMLLGLLFIPLFNSAIVNNQNFTHRLLSLTPIIIIACAFGVELVSEILSRFLNKKIVNAFIIILLGIFAYYNINLYFVKQVWKKALSVNDFRSHSASQIIRTYEPSLTTIYFLGNEAMPRYDATPSLPYMILGYKISNIEDKSILLEKKDYKNTTIIIILPANSAQFADVDMKRLEARGFKRTSYKNDGENLFDVLLLQKPLKKT